MKRLTIFERAVEWLKGVQQPIIFHGERPPEVKG